MVEDNETPEVLEDVEYTAEPDPEDLAQLFGIHPEWDGNAQMVQDKFGNWKRRCQTAKKDGTQCEGFVWRNQNYCKFHGGASNEVREAEGTIATNIHPINKQSFKDFYSKNFDDYLKSVRDPSDRYSIDNQIAILDTIGAFILEVLLEQDQVGVKDMENLIRIHERIANLKEKNVKVESARYLTVTQNSLRDLFFQIKAAIMLNISNSREKIALMSSIRDILTNPNATLLEQPNQADLTPETGRAIAYNEFSTESPSVIIIND